MQKIKFYNLITSDSAALLYFFIFWTSLLGFTKTPFSGIHFQDDHQIITINKELSSDKVIDVISSHVKEDLKIRLRPFYFVHRVLITKILRDNIIYWSLYTGLLAILASFFLYKFIRLLQFSSIESILFCISYFIRTSYMYLVETWQMQKQLEQLCFAMFTFFSFQKP